MADAKDIKDVLVELNVMNRALGIAVIKKVMIKAVI